MSSGHQPTQGASTPQKKCLDVHETPIKETGLDGSCINLWTSCLSRFWWKGIVFPGIIAFVFSQCCDWKEKMTKLEARCDKVLIIWIYRYVVMHLPLHWWGRTGIIREQVFVKSLHAIIVFFSVALTWTIRGTLLFVSFLYLRCFLAGGTSLSSSAKALPSWERAVRGKNRCCCSAAISSCFFLKTM